MAEPFLSEIRIMSFSFAPKGWALCNGQLLPINQNQALFSLLGTTFGGDGRVNFALPDLRGRDAHPRRAAATPSASAAASRRTRCRSPRCRPTPTPSLRRSNRRRRAAIPAGNLSGQARPAGVLRRRTNLVAMDAGSVDEHRRQPGAPQHAAVPDAQLLHRPSGHLPEPELRRSGHGTTLRRRDSHVRRQLRPAGWMFCEGQLLPISRERDALPADRDDLRRRRPDRPSPCPTCAGACRSTRATASSSRRPEAPRRSR